MVKDCVPISAANAWICESRAGSVVTTKSMLVGSVMGFCRIA